MSSRSVLALLALTAACGRGERVPDDQLVGLVVEATPPAKLETELARRDPAELGRALTAPHALVAAALGPHSLLIESRTIVTEGGTPQSELSDRVQLELGDQGSFHGVYTNSEDYGREAIFVGGKLYLRPRYQRWNGRAPETAGEAAEIRDKYFSAIGGTWDLVAPAVELIDRGAAQVAGRDGIKLELKLSAAPRENPREPLSQRRWRETRTIDALDGEVVLDAATGVPLAVKLTAAVTFQRDGRRFTMKLELDGKITALGAVAIAAPPEAEVVVAPTRRHEVDDRDFLLRGIAPPLRKRADGTAIAPTPTPAKEPRK
jgi:hypothetical protein